MPLLFLLADLFRIRYINPVEDYFIYYLLKIFKPERRLSSRNLFIMESLKSTAVNDLTSKFIVFKSDEKKYCFDTNKGNVTVIGSTGHHDHGSSKVKLKNIVDYKWEVKNYPGRLIAVHIDGKHIAYAIKVKNKEAGTEGMVRVVNPTTGNRALIKGMTSEVLDLQFAHLKSQIMLGSIEETALHIHKIETMNNTIVCNLMLKIEDKIVCSPMNGSTFLSNKINWCPYVPENETEVDEYVSHQLVWIRGQTYQCYSIQSLIDMYGMCTILQANSIEGTVKHKETTTITGAAFSPDGTTLCVSCEDGVIRFYQVYFHTNETNPRCLHQWIPHGGQPVSSFFFLDNHTKSSDKSLWRHAITTSANNTEIKVWCCSTWECTQTINFKSGNPNIELNFIAEIDRTSSYFVLSDLKNRELYVLQIEKETIPKNVSIDDSSSSVTNSQPNHNHHHNHHHQQQQQQQQHLHHPESAKRLNSVESNTSNKSSQENLLNNDEENNKLLLDGEDSSSAIDSAIGNGIIETTATSAISLVGQIPTSSSSSMTKERKFSDSSDSDDPYSLAYIKSISEFPLSSPILSFGIVDAAVRKYKCAYNDSYLIEELDDYDEENHLLYCVVIHMFLVQPKSVQECHVLYQPSISESAEVDSTMSSNSDENNQIEILEQSTELIGIKSSASSAQSSKLLAVKPPESSERLTPKVIAAAAAAASAIAPIATVPIPIKQQLPLMKIENTILPLLPTPLQPSTSATVGHQQQQPLPLPPPPQQQPTILMTPDSFQSPSGKLTPEGVSNEVLNTLRMLAQVQTPGDSSKLKSSDNINLLNLVNNKVIEDKEQQLLRQSVESKKQVLVAAASGGSSPSREVQEILSLKDSDCLNEFYDEIGDRDGDDDEQLIETKNIIDESYNFNESCAKDGKDKSKLGSALSNPTTNGTMNNISNNNNNNNIVSNKTDWPKVPQVPPPSMSNLHCVNFNNNNNANNNNPGSGGNVVSSGGVVGGGVSSNNSSINDISYKLDQILEFMQTQSCQMSELRSVVDYVELQKMKNDDCGKLEKLTKSMEFNIPKLIEEHLNRYEREHNKRLEAMLLVRENQHREFRESIVHSVTQMVSNKVTERLSTVLVNEMQRLIPLVVGKLDNITAKIQTDIGNKLTVCDQILRDNITKVCQSKQMMDHFGNAVMASVKGTLPKICSESIRTIMLPTYENATAEMFKQIQTIFSQGTKDYVKQFDSYMTQYEPLHDEIMGQLQNMPDQLKLASDTMLSNCAAQLNQDIQRDLKAMQNNLMKTIRDNVKNEVQKGFESQVSNIEDSVRHAVRSQAQTPAAPSVFDIQEQIKLLLAQGQINSAFHQALVANDLTLVELTLERADYNQVFNPCPLQQTVLLSLIQQVSADMSNHNELKQKYLADAILSLNLRDPTTKEHAPKVMREMYQHCQDYTTANKSGQLVSGVRMLMMCIQALGIKF